MSATGQALPSMQGVYCPMEAEHMASVPAGAYLFRDRKSRPYRDDALLANYLTPRLKKLGLKWPGFGWHAFRRLMATWIAENGATPWEIMTQLGHADVRTSQLYVVGGRNVEKRAERVRAMQEDFAEQVRDEGEPPAKTAPFCVPLCGMPDAIRTPPADGGAA